MQPFRMQSLEALYDEIVRRCHPKVMPSTFDMNGLRKVLPRPQNPEPGIPLGTPLEDESSTTQAVPLRRNDERRQRRQDEGVPPSGPRPRGRAFDAEHDDED